MILCLYFQFQSTFTISVLQIVSPVIFVWSFIFTSLESFRGLLLPNVVGVIWIFVSVSVKHTQFQKHHLKHSQSSSSVPVVSSFVLMLFPSFKQRCDSFAFLEHFIQNNFSFLEWHCIQHIWSYHMDFICSFSYNIHYLIKRYARLFWRNDSLFWDKAVISYIPFSLFQCL